MNPLTYKKIGDAGMIMVVMMILTIVLSHNFNTILAYYYIMFAQEFQLGLAALFIGFFGISHIGHQLSGDI
jgi:hypothetical protein